jgi:hypothetical protein
MDAPKAKRDKEKRKRSLAGRLPVEFLAEYPMEECINRLLRRDVEDREALEGGAYRFWLKGLQLKLEPWELASTRVIIEKYSPSVWESVYQGAIAPGFFQRLGRKPLQLLSMLALIVSCLGIGTGFVIDNFDLISISLAGILICAILYSLLKRLYAGMDIVEEALGNTLRGSFTRENKHK